MATSEVVAGCICEFEDPTNGSATAALPAMGARVSTTTEAFAEGYQVDADGKKVVNAAGEPYDTAMERQAGVKVYTIRKYVTATVKAQIEAAWNTNNDAPKTIQGRTWAADELWLYSNSYEQVDGASVWDATDVAGGSSRDRPTFEDRSKAGLQRSGLRCAPGARANSLSRNAKSRVRLHRRNRKRRVPQESGVIVFF